MNRVKSNKVRGRCFKVLNTAHTGVEILNKVIKSIGNRSWLLLYGVEFTNSVGATVYHHMLNEDYAGVSNSK